MTSWSRRRFLLAAGTVAALACTPSSRPDAGVEPLYANPAKNEWPTEFSELPAETQAMYRYAAVNYDTLRYIPCFCGCVAGGHRSNFDCYVREVYADGGIGLDTMSFG